MKRNILTLLLLFVIGGTMAQNSAYLETLDSIFIKSLQNRSLTAGFTTDSLEYRKGLNPADPRFEIAYFFDNSFESTLSVDLDMPSLYHQRNVLSKLNTGRAKAGYRQERIEILSDISDCYLELIYNTKLNRFLREVVSEDSTQSFKKRVIDAFERGDINALDYSNLQISYITLKDALKESSRQIDILTDRLHMYDSSFTLKDAEFPQFDFGEMTSAEFVEEVLSRSPVSEIKEKDSLIYQRELKAAKWEWAPKIIIGGRLDLDENHNFAPGAVAGLSIPLWEKRGNIRQAKAKIISGAIENERKVCELQTELEELYTKYKTANELMDIWKEYDIDYHCKILFKAYKGGKIEETGLYLEFSRIVENASKMMQIELEQVSCAARMLLLLNS